MGKGKLFKCGYCRKGINPNKAHGMLASGLLLHDRCYSKAFTKKSLRARLFRFKNNWLCRLSYFEFLVGYIKWIIKKNG